jgi:hypothetical protein
MPNWSKQAAGSPTPTAVTEKRAFSPRNRKEIFLSGSFFGPIWAPGAVRRVQTFTDLTAITGPWDPFPKVLKYAAGFDKRFFFLQGTD